MGLPPNPRMDGKGLWRSHGHQGWSIVLPFNQVWPQWPKFRVVQGSVMVQCRYSHQEHPRPCWPCHCQYRGPGLISQSQCAQTPLGIKVPLIFTLQLPSFSCKGTGSPSSCSSLPICTHGPCCSEGLAFYCRDTAGQERYQTITKQYYRRAQVSHYFQGLEVGSCHPYFHWGICEYFVH